MKTKKLSALKAFGVAATGSVALIAPLSITSCGSKASSETRFDAIGGDIDKEFGISEATYKAYQNEFVTRLRINLTEERHLPTSQVEKEINRLNKSLNEINRSVASDTRYSFSLLCSMLVERARLQYGIKLGSQSNVQWSDIDNLYYGMKNSFDAYMLSIRMDKTVKEQILTNSWNQYKLMINGDKKQNVVGLKQKYGDCLSALVQAKSKIISCFSEINANIALASATQRLNEFLSDYAISVDLAKAHLDELESKIPALDTPDFDLTNDFNSIFKITRKIDNKPISFNPNILPGFTIKPVLKNISRDIYSNSYALNVDWTCCQSAYLFNKDINKEKATAHLYTGNSTWNSINNLALKDDAADLLSGTIKPIAYPIFLSQEGEQKALQEAYFSNSSKNDTKYNCHIKIDWDKDETGAWKDTAYEAFFQGEKISSSGGYDVYELNSNALAASGLTLTRIDNASNGETKPVRLDKCLIGGIDENDKRRTNSDDVNDFTKLFVQNCDLSSIATIQNDSATSNGGHIVTNKLFVSYKRTYSVDHNITSLNLGNYETNGFPISEKAYSFLVTTYNSLQNQAELYTKNGEFDEQIKAIDEEYKITFIMLAVSVFLNAFCSSAVILNPPKMLPFIILLILSTVSQVCQFVDFFMLQDNKYIPAHNYADSIDKLVNSAEGKAYLSMLKNDANKFHLPRMKKNENTGFMTLDKTLYHDSFDLFNRDAPNWEEVKEILDRYQNIEKVDEYKNFFAKVDELGVSPEEYKNIMKGWMPFGWYWGWSVGLNVLSFTCDIVSMAVSPAETKDEVAEKQALQKAKLAQLSKDMKATRSISLDREGEAQLLKEIGGITPEELANVSKEEKQIVGQIYSKYLPPDYPKRHATVDCIDYSMYQLFDKYWMPGNMIKFKDFEESGDFLQTLGFSTWKRFIKSYSGSQDDIPNVFINWGKKWSKITDDVADVPFGPEFLKSWASQLANSDDSALSFLNNIDEGIHLGFEMFDDATKLKWEKFASFARERFQNISKPEELVSSLDDVWKEICANKYISPDLIWSAEDSIVESNPFETFMFRFFTSMTRSYGHFLNEIDEAYRSGGILLLV